jgi:hypothetical protein
MFDTLFADGYAFKILFAFIVVFGVLALALWLVLRFRGGRLSNDAGRGRQQRLAVLGQAVVDKRRRLVLIRRDNVEHLILIGGATDVVIEPQIVRAGAVRPHAAPRPLPAGEAVRRALPLGEGSAGPRTTAHAAAGPSAAEASISNGA